MEKQQENSYHDLIVYQQSRWLAREIYEMTNSFPREEIHSLTSQIRRSSRAIGAQIAAAWAKRGFEKYFIGKLTDADGEQHETQHWIEVARDCGYISDEKSQLLIGKCRDVGNLILDMLEQASTFGKPPSRPMAGTQAEYVID